MDSPTRRNAVDTTREEIGPASTASEEEWLAERARYAILALRDSVDVNPDKHGGVPVLRGSRFTVILPYAPNVSESVNIAAPAQLPEPPMDRF